MTKWQLNVFKRSLIYSVDIFLQQGQGSKTELMIRMELKTWQSRRGT